MYFGRTYGNDLPSFLCGSTTTGKNRRYRPPSADKVRVYVKGNIRPRMREEETGRRLTMCTKRIISSCSNILWWYRSLRDYQTVKMNLPLFGNRNPSRYQMEAKRLGISQEIGRALNADYVVVTARWTNSISRSVNMLVVFWSMSKPVKNMRQSEIKILIIRL